jgi:hypothetical protein
MAGDMSKLLLIWCVFWYNYVLTCVTLMSAAQTQRERERERDCRASLKPTKADNQI